MGYVNTKYGRVESYVELVSQNWGNNTSVVRLIVRFVNNGTSRSYRNSATPLSVWGSGSYSGSIPSFDVAAGSWQNVAVLDFTCTHDSAGNLGVNFGMDVGNTGTTTFGDPPAFENGAVSITRIPKRPNPPGTPSVSNNTTGTTFTVSWTASGNNQGSAITGYLLRIWKNSSASGSYVDSGPANNLSRNCTGFAKGTTYTVGVYAKNSAADNGGYSNLSGTRTFTTPKEPNAPATPTSAYSAPGNVTISWSAPTNNGASVTEYQMEYADNSSFSGSTTVSAGTATSKAVVISGSGYGKTWYFRVRAKNSVGWGAYSAAKTVAIPTSPSTPGMPTLEYFAPSTIKIAWSAPSNGGATITGYTVQYADNTSFSNAKSTSVTGTTATITDVEVGKTWYFRVLAKNSQGSSSYSSANSVLVVCGPRVRINGVWKNTIAYVRVSGVWKTALPYVRVSGVWKNGGG